MKIPRLSDSVQSPSMASKPGTVIHHGQYTAGETSGGLSVFFTILCIVDLFGVFPVVALPKSIIACGLYGIPLVLGVFAMQLYTAVLLGKCWLLAYELCPNIREKSRFPYAAVAELAFGDNARILVTFFIDATVFGASVPNFIFASQTMQLFWWKITGGGVGVTYCVWMIFIGLLLCPVMWLGSPKDMKSLAVTSVCIVTTVAVATWACIIMDDVSPSSLGGVMDYTPSTSDFLVAYGIISFQFDVHPILLTLQVDMKDSRRISRAVLGAFLITGFMFTVTSLLAAYRYGNNFENNILQGMPPSITLYIVVLLVTLQLCLSSVLGNSVLFQHLEDLLKIPKNFCLQRCLVRSGIVALAVFLGESVPRFDLVMGLVGSTLTGPLMFIFPPLFFLKLCYLKANNVKQEYSLSYKPKQLKTTKNDPTQNGANDLQNDADLSKCPLISNDTCTPEYQTFGNYEEIYRRYIDEYNVKWFDVMLASIVMLFGITATIVATYSSWADAISSSTFSPPCLLNATAAARSFLPSSSQF